MAQTIDERLDRLESLYAEQDHLIEGLDDALARQDQELLRLRSELENLSRRLQSLKAGLSDIDPAHDKPPHY